MRFVTSNSHWPPYRSIFTYTLLAGRRCLGLAAQLLAIKAKGKVDRLKKEILCNRFNVTKSLIWGEFSVNSPCLER